MSTFMRIIGTKDLREKVESMNAELPKMRTEIKDEIVTEIANALQASEVRIKNELQTFFAEIREHINVSPSPKEIVHAIEQNEEDKEREKLREEIISSLSVLYTKEKEVNLFTKSKRGTTKLTKDGDEIYKILSDTILKIAKYHGYKSPNKVANKTTYKNFQLKYGFEGEPTKRSITFSNGTKGRTTVYVDLIIRGLVGKFAMYLEKEFISERSH